MITLGFLGIYSRLDSPRETADIRRGCTFQSLQYTSSCMAGDDIKCKGRLVSQWDGINEVALHRTVEVGSDAAYGSATGIVRLASSQHVLPSGLFLIANACLGSHIMVYACHMSSTSCEAPAPIPTSLALLHRNLYACRSRRPRRW